MYEFDSDQNPIYSSLNAILKERPEEDKSGTTVGAFARTAARIPENLAAKAIMVAQGQSGASVADRGIADRFVNWVEKRNRELAREYEGAGDFIPGVISKQDVAELGPNLAFSGVSMAGAVGGGVAGAPLGLPGIIAGRLAGGGAAAYRMDSYQAMNEWLNKKNEESIAQGLGPITRGEEEKFKRDFNKLATEHGLWEAGPEAIGNVLDLAFMAAKNIVPAGRLVPQFAKGKLVGGVMRTAGILGTEEATETVTQMGQQRTEVEAGQRGDELPRQWTSGDDWLKSAKEVLPQVLLLTGAMTTGGAIYRQSRDKKETDKKIRDDLLNDITVTLKNGTVTATEVMPLIARAYKEKIFDETDLQKIYLQHPAIRGDIEQFVTIAKVKGLSPEEAETIKAQKKQAATERAKIDLPMGTPGNQPETDLYTDKDLEDIYRTRGGATEAERAYQKYSPMLPFGMRAKPPGEPTAPPGEPTAPPGEPTAPPGEPTAPPGEPTAPPGEPTAPPGEPTAPRSIFDLWQQIRDRIRAGEDLDEQAELDRVFEEAKKRSALGAVAPEDEEVVPPSEKEKSETSLAGKGIISTETEAALDEIFGNKKEEGEKVKVKFLGMQKAEGEESIPLIDTGEGYDHYDPAKHEITNREEYEKALLAEEKGKAEKPAIEIPELKGSREAVEFGKTATPEQVDQLKVLRDEAYAESDKLQAENRFDDAVFASSKANLYREAIDASEGILTGPPPMPPIIPGIRPKAAGKMSEEQRAVIEDAIEVHRNYLNRGGETSLVLENAIDRGVIPEELAVPIYDRIQDLERQNKLGPVGEERTFLINKINEYFDNLFYSEKETAVKPSEAQETEPVAPPSTKEGDKHSVMGTDSIAEKVETINGVSYELWKPADKNDKSGVVRIYDSESGNTVGIKKYPDFKDAQKFHEKNISLAKEEVEPVPLPVTPESPENKKIGTPDKLNPIGLSDEFYGILDTATTVPKLNKITLQEMVAGWLGISRKELIDYPGFSHKPIEEAFELALVRKARDIIEAGGSREDIATKLHDLYKSQPLLGTRTGASTINQAYSTPIHVGYILQDLAGVTQNTTVYEPTAGEGSLLTVANPKKVRANEIDDLRAKLLEHQGFFVVSRNDAQDAVASGKGPRAKGVDRVVANPPFGSIPKTKKDDYLISKLEHSIVMDALKAMKDDGKAAFIIGGKNFKDGKMTETDRIFLNWLYRHYNVIANIDVDGSIYARQGTKFDIRVIAVDGRKAEPSGAAPYDAESYQKADSFEELVKVAREAKDGKYVAEYVVAKGTSAIREREKTSEPSDRSRGEAGTEEVPGHIRGETGKAGGEGEGDYGGRPDKSDQGHEPESHVVIPGTRETIRSGGVADAGGVVVPADEYDGGVPEREPVTEGTRGAVPGGTGRGEIPRAFGGKRPGGRVDVEGTAGVPSSLTIEEQLDNLSLNDIDNIIEKVIQKRKSNLEKPSEKPVTPSLKTAGKHLSKAFGEAMKGLDVIFGGPNTLGSGMAFDEETYKKAKPYFQAAVKEANAAKIEVEELISYLVDKYEERIQPYIQRFFADSKAKRERGEKTVTSYQITYSPKSKGPIIDETLIPIYLQEPIAKALDVLEKEVGVIDEYVARKLKYESVEKMWKHLAADQVDAVALAINNLDKGVGMIIGDQTGMGKGRDAAAIIEYAKTLGIKPVFFTEKGNLFSDIYRDMVDIGKEFEPFIMASSKDTAQITDKNGKVVHKLLKPSERREAYNEMLNKGQKALDDYDCVLTTYSQINHTDNTQQQCLVPFLTNSILILDESHNASGDSRTGRYLAERLQSLRGVVYLSATFAKNPESMGIYAATAMGDSNLGFEELCGAINAGGIPLQEHICRKLAEYGQMIRREKSFEGVQCDTIIDSKNRERDEKLTDASTEMLNAIIDLDEYIKPELADIRPEDGQIFGVPVQSGGISATGRTVQSTVQTSNFASTVHNYVSQMMLCAKCDSAVDLAIEELKNGRKPVIGIQYTLGTMMESAVKAGDVKIGDRVDLTFKDLLKRMLNKTRILTIKHPNGEKDHVLIPVEALSERSQKFYRYVENMIADSNIDLPGSPIDYIKAKLKKAGYNIEEITGRKYVVDLTDPDNLILKARTEQEIKDKNTIIRGFVKKGGGTDGLIINASGAAGISLHTMAGPEYDQRGRTYIGAQAELNVNTEIQKRGRFHRKGQVNVPIYKSLYLDIPSETRPACVLMRKEKSLSATTSANADSPLAQKKFPDLFNKYGDQVARAWLDRHPDFTRKLRYDGTEGLTAEKITGRVSLLPVRLQKIFYNEVEEEYNLYVQDLKEQGLYDLETAEVDFKAEILEKKILTVGKNENSYFGQSTWLEKLRVKSTKKPLRKKAIEEMIAENLGGKTSDQFTADFIKDVSDATDAYIAEQARLGKELEEEEKTTEARIRRINGVRHRVLRALDACKIGYTYRIGSDMRGVLINIRRQGKDGNPSRPSAISFTFAVNTAQQKRTYPMSRINEFGNENMVHIAAASNKIIDNWDELLPTDFTMQRYVITGNLTQGFADAPMQSRLVIFTMADGTKRDGILTPLNYNPGRGRASEEVRISPEQAVRIATETDRTRQIPLISEDVIVSPDKVIRVPKSKAKGGKYFQDSILRSCVRGDFESRGKYMQASILPEKIRDLIDRLHELGCTFKLPRSDYDRLLGQEEPTTTTSTTTEQYELGKSIPVKGDESLLDILRKAPPLKNATMGTSPDGSVWVRNKNGKGFVVRSVKQIEPNKTELLIGHGRMLEKGEFIAGKYVDSRIELVRGTGREEWTATHESIHFFEDLGYISSIEKAIMSNHIKRLQKEGKWDSGNREVGGEEDRAVFITENLRDRSIKGPLGRILQKISDLVDAFVNLFKRTAKGVMRDIESGKVFDRDLGKPLREVRLKTPEQYQALKHGTPHVWPPEKGYPHGRPRLDKIGTGEGAAAYGHGFYLAEAEGVARYYKKTIQQKGWGSTETPSLEDAGSLYTLDLPDDVLPKLLDWDKPLSEQSEYVKKALAPALTDKFDSGIVTEVYPGYWEEVGADQLPEDGTDFETGETAYARISGELGSDKAASEYLASIGIPGNKYLDAESRGTNIVQPWYSKSEKKWIVSHTKKIVKKLNKLTGTATVELSAQFDTEQEAATWLQAQINSELTYNYVIWDQNVLDRMALLERNGEKLDAIRLGDAKANILENIKSEEEFSAPEHYSVASNYKPKKTIKAYKLLRTMKSKTGQYFPLFIGKAKPIEVNRWLIADFLPTKGFAPRPGWHAGALPIAPHLRQHTTGKKHPDRVWAEVEMPDDRNWQSVADNSPTKDIRNEIPKNGSYLFPTSKMQGSAWRIGGAIKITKILSDKEVANILSQAGYDASEISKEMSGFAGIKSEKGSSELINDLSQLGADAIKRGHKSFKAFSQEMKRILGEVWDKIRPLMQRAYEAARVVLKSQRGMIDIGPVAARPPGQPPKTTVPQALKAAGIAPKLKAGQALPRRARSIGLESPKGKIYLDVSKEAKELAVELGMIYPKEKVTFEQLEGQAERIMRNDAELVATLEKARKGTKKLTDAEVRVIRKVNAAGLENVVALFGDTDNMKKINKVVDEYREGIFKLTQNLHSERGAALNALKMEVSTTAITNAFSKLNRELQEKDRVLFNNALEAFKFGNHKPMASFLKYLEETKDDPTIADYVYEYWYNCILSGVPTNIVNVASNTTWTVWQLAVHKPLLAAIDPIVARFQKRQTEYYIDEIIPALAGIRKGFKPGAKAAKEIMIKGYTTDAQLDKWALEMGKTIGAFARSPNKYLRRIARWLTIPTKSLRAMDVWFNQANYQAELAAICKRKEKKGDKSFEYWMQNPTEEMMNEAAEYASYTTFMNEPGKFTVRLEAMRETVPGGRFIVPFIRTIANLTKRGVEMTPGLGFILGRKAKGKEVSHVIVKQIEGLFIAAVIASMLDDDRLTGPVPSDKAAREAFYRQGKLPWAIRIGDRWVQYRRLEPFNGPIASVAIAYNSWKKTGEINTDLIYKIATGIADNILDSSYMSGLTQALDAVRSADTTTQKINNMIDRTIASFSPMSSFQRSFVRAAEAMRGEGAIVRKPKGVAETLMASTPFLSEKVPSKKDVWGKDVIIHGSPVEQWLPWKTSRAGRDKVEVEIERLHREAGLSYPGMPAKYAEIKGERIDFTDKQYDNLLKESGQAAKKRLDDLVGTSYWNSMSDEEKAKRIDRVIKDARKKARNKLKRELAGKPAFPGVRLNIPEINVPEINVPKINIPEMNF